MQYVSFSEFFDKYASTIELFPDYEKPKFVEKVICISTQKFNDIIKLIIQDFLESRPISYRVRSMSEIEVLFENGRNITYDFTTFI